MMLGPVLRSAGFPVFLIGVASLIFGCSATGTVPLSKETQSSIHAVSVASEVAPPGQVRCVATVLGVLTDCGRISLLQAQASEVGSIVRDRFEASLKGAGVFPSVVAEGGDATFTLWARRVMLSVVPGMCGVMGNCYATVVEAQGTLRTRTGTVLWLQLQMGQAPKSRGMSEFDEHPELLRADFNLAAQAAADKLVQEIVRKRR